MNPVSKGLQCKDIPDELFLKAVDECAWSRDRPYAMLWDVQAYVSAVMWKELMENLVDDVGPLMATLMDPINNSYNMISPKLIRNKARKLIRRGLMSGCYCGCRGEWRIVPNVMVSGDQKSLRISGIAGKLDGE